MKSLLIYILLGLIFVSNKGVICTGRDPGDSEYPNDDEDEEGDDLDEDESGELGQSPTVNIISVPLNIEVKAGSKVTLPCFTDNPDVDIMEWFFGTTRLYMDDLKLDTDNRLTRNANGSLIITDVTANDSGNYSCVLINNHKFLNHTIHVTTAARIVDFNLSRDGLNKHKHIVWMKGSKQRIYCNAVGYPIPEVTISHTWIHGKHKSSEVRSLHGNPIIIDDVQREHAGKYTCEARNTLYLTSKALHVEVEYAPMVHIEREYQSAVEGVETLLTCKVVAHPSAEVVWLKNGSPLILDSFSSLKEHIEELVSGNKHTLIIKRTTREDFGNYTCRASNMHGSNEMSVKVSGEPGRPVIDSIKLEEDDPVVTWKIQSLAPLSEILVEYKKQEMNNWMEIKVEMEESSREGSDSYVATHRFDQLEEGTYQTRVKARNSYGWSETSYEKTLPGNKLLSHPRAANSFSQLESSRDRANDGSQLRVSAIFILSLFAAHMIP